MWWWRRLHSTHDRKIPFTSWSLWKQWYCLWSLVAVHLRNCYCICTSCMLYYSDHLLLWKSKMGSIFMTICQISISQLKVNRWLQTKDIKSWKCLLWLTSRGGRTINQKEKALENVMRSLILRDWRYLIKTKESFRLTLRKSICQHRIEQWRIWWIWIQGQSQ